jgi:serine protease Do
MLVGVLIWYGVSGRSKQAYGGMSVGEVAERISPSTVLIYTTRRDGNYASGTGFFIRSDGYIATNYHVVEQGKEFEVTLYSAKRVSAELVGTSKENDLAILKIKGNRYPVVTFGNSDEVKVGDVAIVVGNPNGAHGAWTTTEGIISAVDRQSTINNKTYKMFQTDAAVNPGNSGGPLCNDQGEVIGVITQIMLDQDGVRSEGFGMAIPGNKAKAVLADILARKKN